MGSRRCMSDLHMVFINISAFIPPCHQGLCPHVKEISISSLQPGRDSLLHVSCCEWFTSYKFLRGPKETENSGQEIGTVGREVHNLQAICYPWAMSE
jgi:hypothetical protein